MRKLVLLLTLSMVFTVFGQDSVKKVENYVQDEMSSGNLVEADNKEMTVIAKDAQGKPILAKVYDKETGLTEVIGLGSNTMEAQRNFANHLEYRPTEQEFKRDFLNGTMTFRLVAALRLQFPELVGFRVGMRIGEHVELGYDAGTMIFISSGGWYVNVHPMGHKTNGWRNLYVGYRNYKTAYFAILAVATTRTHEGIIGYKFDKKPGGFYSFVEGGVSVAKKSYTSSYDGQVHTWDDAPVLPVVGFGFGWNIRLNNRR